MGWFRRSVHITGDKARRVTGISSPFGGIQWADPGPSDRDTVRQFILFLEDRRALYNPMLLEIEDQVDRSVHEIREQCTKALQALGTESFAAHPLRLIRGAARQFHNDRLEEFRFFDHRFNPRDGSRGFFTALGAFRAAVGYQVALLAAHYDLTVEGDLAAMLPDLDDGNDPV